MRQSLIQSFYAKKSEKTESKKGRRLTVYEKLQQLEEEEPKPVEKEAPASKFKLKKKSKLNFLQKEGKPVGFWCLPVNNSYVKLPIRDFYMLFDQKVGGPVWSILLNADKLASKWQKLFPAISEWFNSHVEGSIPRMDDSFFNDTEVGRELKAWFEERYSKPIEKIKDFFPTKAGKEISRKIKDFLKNTSPLERFLQSIDGQALLNKDRGQILSLLKTAMADGLCYVLVDDAQQHGMRKAGKRVIIGSTHGDFTRLPYWEELKNELSSRELTVGNKLDGDKVDANNLLYLIQVDANGGLTRKPFDTFGDMMPTESRTMQHAQALVNASELRAVPSEMLYDFKELLQVFDVIYKEDPSKLKLVISRLVTWGKDMEPEQKSAVTRAIKAIKHNLRDAPEPESTPAPPRGPVPDPNLQNAPVSESLTEMSFKQLWALTSHNGGYKYGGMKKVRGVWFYDVKVPGRVHNGSRFVVTRPPKMSVAADGNPQMVFNVKSRPDRSTTGLRQQGYVKFVFKTKRGQQSSSTFRSDWGRNVQVFCSCPDFKFRWHKVLFDAGASHEPAGGLEATNAYPGKTNPGGKLSLCKHLVAVSKYLSMSQRDLDKYFKEIDEIHQAGLEPDDDGGAPNLDPDADNKPNVSPI